MTRESALEHAERLLDLGRPRDAEERLRPLLAEDPGDGRALALLCHALSDQDRDLEALDAAEAWVAADPRDDAAHRMRSVGLTSLGRHEEAVDAALEAVHVEPEGWANHVQYAIAAARIDRLRPYAETAAARAVELAPLAPDAHYVQGVIAQAQRRVEVAIACARETLRLEPTHAGARHLLTELEGGVLGWRRQLGGYRAALAHAPGQTFTTERLHGLILRAVAQVYAIALLGLLLLTGSPGPGRRATVAILVVLGVVLLAVSAHRALDAGLRAFVRARVRADRHLQAAAVVTLAQLALTLAAAVVPLPAASIGPVLLGLGLAAVAVLVWGVVRAGDDD